ncbi:tail fiber protein [bacterium]|nr:tail fiber protein [bacterium]
MKDISGSDTGEAIIGYGDNGNENLVFYSQNNTTLTETMRLNGSGNLDVVGEVTATDFVLSNGISVVPAGAIIMWSGAINAIPTGWLLCTGANGTPNLSGKFVVGYSGAGDYATMGNTGGSDSRTLTTANMPAHNHSGAIGIQNTNHTHSGTSGSNNQNHSHTANSEGSHNHGIPTYQDDWNDSGGYGPSWGDGDNGTWANHHSTAYNGNHSHTLNAQNANHTHNFTTAGNSANHSHSLTINNTGSGTAFDNRPSYYTIAYIMKAPY